MFFLQDVFPGLTPATPAPENLPDVKADLAMLKDLSFNDLLSRLAETMVNFAINVAIAILVFYVGRFIIRKIFKIVSAIFIRRKVDTSLSTFVLSLINIVLYFILIVTVIGIIGIETTSFLAIFASAGVAIGMALSGTLQNFAGGVLILLLKPYKIGDYIEVQGYAGTVREIQIFSTIITTYDNKSISIPNGSLSTGSVNNWSREAYRRVTWTISISYGDDVNAVREAILNMFRADSRIEQGDDLGDEKDFQVVGTAAENAAAASAAATLAAEIPASEEAPAPERKRTFWDKVLFRHRKTKEKISQWEQERETELLAMLPKPNFAPAVYLSELAASSVDIQVRAWTKTSDYWAVFYYYNEKFYNELPAVGAHFPFPQLDVHMA
ncbi:MAG: mechanosensitive ion channel [[Clostridium] fimetarium]|nr:mechanosensitive ion channel [Alistipes timonensis]MCM1406511.1 mechanosensitive ion channel [[Clostridium] fimetarium]